ncbi:MAG: hypothetical protein AAFX01_06295 [Cyanobacteria bacterium J06638_28]
MTPEAIRIVGQVRSEFYKSFAATIDEPFTITKGSSYSSNLPKISWVDSLQRSNYICIYAYAAPDVLIPERPLILRLGVNQGLEIESPKRLIGSGLQQPRKLQFCLTLLPSEVLAFVPWVQDCFQSHSQGLKELPAAPSSLSTQKWRELLSQGVWTQSAIACLEKQSILPAEVNRFREAAVDCAL